MRGQARRYRFDPAHASQRCATPIPARPWLLFCSGPAPQPSRPASEPAIRNQGSQLRLAVLFTSQHVMQSRRWRSAALTDWGCPRPAGSRRSTAAAWSYDSDTRPQPNCSEPAAHNTGGWPGAVSPARSLCTPRLEASRVLEMPAMCSDAIPVFEAEGVRSNKKPTQAGGHAVGDEVRKERRRSYRLSGRRRGRPRSGCCPGFISHVEHQQKEPAVAQAISRFTSFTRVNCFDKRSTGARLRSGIPPPRLCAWRRLRIAWLSGGQRRAAAPNGPGAARSAHLWSPRRGTQHALGIRAW